MMGSLLKNLLLCCRIIKTLTHFQTTFHFYTPGKHQRTVGFLMFSRGIEVEHWLKMGYGQYYDTTSLTKAA